MKNFFFFSLILLTVFSCKPSEDENPTPTVTKPAMSIADLTVTESDEDQDVTLTVSLDKAFEGSVVVNYSTVDGSAAGQADFVRLENEEIIFTAGETEKQITVRIRGDQAEEPDETFEVVLINPVNATLNKAAGRVTIQDDDDPSDNGLMIPTDGYTTPDSYEGMTLMWQDEFQGTEVNLDDWTFEIGNGQNGWGNNELQYYRAENTSVVDNDYLVIEARNEAFGGRDYTSSRMITMNKQSFQFGRVDIRAAMPEGQGLWPALWMLGSDFQSIGWPMCGEIDIMELVGHQPGRTHGTVHFGDSWQEHSSKTASKTLPGGAKFSEEFHVFSLVWQENEIQILLDDVVYNTITPSDMNGQNYPFNNDFFFIFNVAVGGQWPGSPDNTTSFPQRMIVDYVRVFQ